MTGKVRIIGGQWRGRRLAVPEHPGLRPSGDRSRETLFNWLAPRIRGARCLDLFAGTGALGLEAASRGAAAVTLVERDRRLCRALDQIATDWPGGDALDVVCADAMAWLAAADGPWDLVFVDPPFDARLHAPILDRLQRPGVLADQARVYLESHAHEPVNIGPHWQVLREKRIGDVTMQLLEPNLSQSVPDRSI